MIGARIAIAHYRHASILFRMASNAAKELRDIEMAWLVQAALNVLDGLPLDVRSMPDVRAKWTDGPVTELLVCAHDCINRAAAIVEDGVNAEMVSNGLAMSQRLPRAVPQGWKL